VVIKLEVGILSERRETATGSADAGHLEGKPKCKKKGRESKLILSHQSSII